MHRLGNRSLLLAAAAIALIGATLGGAEAQAYPETSVRVVVPFAAGGRSDAITRLIANRLEMKLGQPFVVENKAGASGSVGADAVAKADADGYTLLMVSSGVQSILPVTSTTLPYDANRDFAPVAMLVESFSFLGINADVPADTVEEFVAYAKDNPDQLNYASSGIGTYNHFAGEFFNQAAGTNIQHVAYRGSGPSVTDLVAGEVQMMIGGEFLEVAKAGKVKILATTNDQRWADLPDVPTLREAGLETFSAPPLWFGLVAPAGTPADVIETLNRAITEIQEEPEVRDQLAQLGNVVKPMTAEAFGQQIALEQQLYGKIATSGDTAAQ